MLGTFVIGLREGLEAALIVGIVAAFLRQRGRRDLVRWVWVGVAAAALICLAGGIALRLFSENLPQRQQEGLETVIGVVAVVMVTYMIVWMRRHSRELKGQLEGAAAQAIARGSGWALVAMAFLAVLREGFETSVFLLAAYNESDNSTAATVGAALGLAVAVLLGYGIYRGGLRINLSRFFRVTGVLLALVAGGLVVTALHTAHEAGWLNAGQQQVMDISSFVQPGTVWESLISGVFGIQPRPVLIEVIAWLLYVIPVSLYVGWPPGKSLAPRTAQILAAATGTLALLVSAVLMLLAPSAHAAVPSGAVQRPVQTPATGSTGSAAITASAASSVNYRASITTDGLEHSYSAAATRGASARSNGLLVQTYQATVTPIVAAGRPTVLTVAQLSTANGGSLPFGVSARDAQSQTIELTYTDSAQLTIYVEPTLGRIVNVQVVSTAKPVATVGAKRIVLPAQKRTDGWPTEAAAATATATAQALAENSRRSTMLHSAVVTGLVALACALVWGWSLHGARRAKPASAESVINPKPTLVNH